MALIVKHKSTPNQSTQNLVLQETTGVFGILNPGGYGASQTPTGTREISDIISSNFNILEYNGSITYNGSTTPILVDSLYSTLYNNINAQAIANGTTQTFDLATLIGNSYVDGVYKSVYYNWFTGDDVVSASGSNQLALPSTQEAENVKYIKVIDGVNQYIYSVLSVSGNTLTVNGDVSNLGGDYLYTLAYESTAYFANTYNINKCLHNKISKLALSNCSCKNKSTEKLYEAVMMYMSIQPNMDLGKYTKAQEIIKALTIYCNGGECNC
jgi:hypothetical protein